MRMTNARSGSCWNTSFVRRACSARHEWVGSYPAPAPGRLTGDGGRCPKAKAGEMPTDLLCTIPDPRRLEAIGTVAESCAGQDGPS